MRKKTTIIITSRDKFKYKFADETEVRLDYLSNSNSSIEMFYDYINSQRKRELPESPEFKLKVRNLVELAGRSPLIIKLLANKYIQFPDKIDYPIY
jgi:hypothetical protein